MRKEPGKIRNFFYYTFYGLFFLVSIFAFMATLMISGGSGELVAGTVMCSAVLMFGMVKIMSRPYRRFLRGDSRKVWLKNIWTSFVMFNCMVLASILYFFNQSRYEEMFVFVFSTILWIRAIYFFWTLTINLMVVGTPFWKSFILFVRKYVFMYLGYRVIIFAFTLVSSFILLLIAGKSGAESNAAAMLQSYFAFALEDSLNNNLATGFLSGDGGFVNGLTAASSYMVLSELALECLNNKGLATRKERIKRFFLDSDTIKLLVMTVVCVVVSYLPAEGKGDFIFAATTSAKFLMPVSGVAYYVVLAMYTVWYISWIRMIKDTAIMPYLINFCTLYLIEAVVLTPELPGVAGVAIFVLFAIIRIFLFAIISEMIAKYTKAVEEYNSPQKDPNSPLATASGLIYQGTFMQWSLGSLAKGVLKGERENG